MPQRAVLIAALCLGLIVAATGTYASTELQGTVENRDGVAQARCQVEFTNANTSTTYTVWTNSEGTFFLDSPARGSYDVTVTRGKRTQHFDVVVGEGRLTPDPLVVDW